MNDNNYIYSKLFSTLNTKNAITTYNKKKSSSNLEKKKKRQKIKT